MKKPTHVAIIMDGNDRWASNNKMKTYDGHKAGAENAFSIIKSAIDNGIKHLSLFAFSTENFLRPKDEVKNFMGLLDYYAVNEIKKLEELKIKIKFVGDLSRLEDNIVKKLKLAEERSKNNEAINLYILLSYGSRDEIIYACKTIVEQNIKKEEIDEKLFKSHLYCQDMPDVDLLIRTGNHTRISNFLLWQSAYAELYFSSKMWPEFTQEDLKFALEEYSSRKRTFGVR